MRKKIIRELWKTAFFTGILLAITFIGFLIYKQSYINDQTITPLSWNGITPGQTSLTEALTILGEPDSIYQKNGYDVYSYVDKKGLNWHLVEIWAKKNGFKTTIRGILRSIPYLENPEINTLDQLVLFYRQPQKVTWTFFRTTRYLIWTNIGIAVMADADIRYRSWDTFLVDNILIFEPMSLEQFLQTQWPSTDWEDQNLYSGGDSPDTLSEDPYDWKHMPTPIP